MYIPFAFSLKDSTHSQSYIGNNICPTPFNEVVSCTCNIVRLFCQSLHSIIGIGSLTFSVFFFFFFFFFFCCPCCIWWFPGWGSHQSYSCQPMSQTQQHRIQATSATYTTAHGNTGFLTH